MCHDEAVTWTPGIAFTEGLDFFSGVVAHVGAADWQRPSPCPGWDARDIVGHIGSAVDFGTRFLLGQQPAWEPADPPGAAIPGDPAGWWVSLVEPARGAVESADLDEVRDSPAGPRTVGDGLSFPSVDLFIHGWDLGRAVGVDIVIPAAAIAFAHGLVDPLPANLVRSDRVFGPEFPFRPAFTPTQALIAWAGRDPDWAPPGTLGRP